MATDQGPVVQSALLRLELVRMRKANRLTQEQVATALEWSPSKLIRVEGGRTSITKVDLDALLVQYGVTSESERLQALNRGARERAWWDAYRGQLLDPVYLDYVGYEAGAAIIRQFIGTVVPGLLQTREYVEALTEIGADAMQVAAVVNLRLQRQSELRQRSVSPRQDYVLDESVTRRHVGISKDPAIMPNQLRYLADMAEDDEFITIRVIPFKAGFHPGLASPFTLLEFDGGLPDILYLDAGMGTIRLLADNTPLIAEYRDNFETMLAEALPPDDSVEFIRAAAAEMD